MYQHRCLPSPLLPLHLNFQTHCFSLVCPDHRVCLTVYVFHLLFGDGQSTLPCPLIEPVAPDPRSPFVYDIDKAQKDASAWTDLDQRCSDRQLGEELMDVKRYIVCHEIKPLLFGRRRGSFSYRIRS